jgi:hypothetical protein
MHIIKPVIAAAASISIVAPAAPVGKRISPELYDYLVQDVCIDDAGSITAEDPITCAKRRDIMLGEKSPYLLTDTDTSNNATYQAMNSVPVRGTDGSIRILYPKLNQGPFDKSFRMTRFTESVDGYDLADISNSDFVSMIRTSDGGCFDQIWSRTGKHQTVAQRAGGWALFPLATPPGQWLPSQSEIIRTHKVQLTSGLGHCKNGSSRGITYWTRAAPFVFNTGKTVSAITSSHFANARLSRVNNALERFYFSREYGFTRWEAWVPQQRCVKERGKTAAICFPGRADYPPSLHGRCNQNNKGSTGIAGLNRWGNQNWVRVDCRDLTNHIALDTPTRLMTRDMANTNGVRDIDTAATENPVMPLR